jgi:hypothetical protein
MKFRVTSKLIKDIDMTVFDELKRRINGADKVVNVGVPEGKKEKDGTPVAMVAAVHEYGSPSQGIPERPFLRVAIQKNRLKYVRLNRTNIVKMLRGQMGMEQALGQLGEMAKGDVQTEIWSGDFAPLAPKTIAARRRARSSAYNKSLKKKADAKGGGAGPIDRPLIDTGQMVQSIQWELGDKNHD